jgi:hypothetical protein
MPSAPLPAAKRPARTSSSPARPLPKPAAVAIKTSTKAQPSEAEIKAAEQAAACVEAISAAFAAHSAQLSTGRLPVERFPPALVDLCDAANRCLAIFTELELNGEVSVAETGRWSRHAGPTAESCDQLQKYCTEVLRGLEALRPVLQAVQGHSAWTDVADAVVAVGDLKSFAAVLGEVRAIVSQRNLARARALLSTTATKRTAEAERLLEWLRKRWVPAMDALETKAALVDSAARRKDAVALRSAIEETKEWARRAELAPVALRGETVEAIVHETVVAPAERTAAQLQRGAELEAAAKDAIDRCDFAALAAAVRQMDVEDAAVDATVAKQARDALLQLQRMASITVTLTEAIRNETDHRPLVAAITAANEHMLAVGCSGDAAKSRSAIQAAAAVLKSADDALDPGVVERLAVEHVTGRGWAAELSLLYYKAVKQLRRSITVVATGRSLTAALERLRGDPAVREEDRAAHAAAQRLGLDKDPRYASTLQELGLHIRRAFGVTVKVHHDSTTRAVVVEERMSFAAVRRAVSEAFGGDDGKPALRLRYEDDGDYIVVDSQAAWELLIGPKLLGGSGANGVKVELYADRVAPFLSPDKRGAQQGKVTPPAEQPQKSPPPAPTVASAQPKFRITKPQGPLAAALDARPTSSGGRGAKATVEAELPPHWDDDGGRELDLRTVASEATTAAVSFDPLLRARANLGFIERQLRGAELLAATAAAPPTNPAPQLPGAWAKPDDFELQTVASEMTIAPSGGGDNAAAERARHFAALRAQGHKAPVPVPAPKASVAKSAPPKPRLGISNPAEGIEGFILRGTAGTGTS